MDNRGIGHYRLYAPSLNGDWGGEVCNQEIARVVGSLSALQAGGPKGAHGDGDYCGDPLGFPPPLPNGCAMTGSLEE
jgi:hypothetical protein